MLQDDNTEEVTKELLLENEELKARLRALELDCGKSVTDSSETRTKLEMEAVREKLVKLVQERGQAKENCATAMNLA